MATILNLSNMAHTARAQLGSREKAKLYDLGYKWFKCDALNNYMIELPDYCVSILVLFDVDVCVLRGKP